MTIKYKTLDGQVVKVEGRLFVRQDRNGKDVYEGDRVRFEGFEVEDVDMEPGDTMEGTIVYQPDYGRIGIDMGDVVWRDAPLDEWCIELIEDQL